MMQAWGLWLLLVALPALAAPPAPRAAAIVPVVTARSDEISVMTFLSGGREVTGAGLPVRDRYASGLIDGSLDIQWETTRSALRPALIQLAEPFDLTRIEAVNSKSEASKPGLSLKKLKIESSEKLIGPWSLLAELTLEKGTAPQETTLSDIVKSIRYLRITAVSNHGNPDWYGMSDLAIWGRRSDPKPSDFNGVWSTQYGDVVLSQKGDRVTGCYGVEGSGATSIIEGALDGPVFVGSYTEFDTFGKKGLHGAIAFVITREGELSGVWGSDIINGTARTTRWDGIPKPKTSIRCQAAESVIQTELAEGRVVLRGILFDLSRDIIRLESVPTLNALASALKEQPNQKFVVEGHTDDRGTKEVNQKLSERRATAVVEWLIANGVSSEQLTAIGYGASRPAMPNDTVAGRTANRRVEVARGN